jgi:hypothetical protein
MTVQILRAFFGWCTVINGALLLFATLVCTVAGDWIYRMHSRLFPISRQAFTLAMYCFIGGMKTVVLMFNLVPYVTLVVLS